MDEGPGNSAIVRKVVGALRQCAERCVYITSRENCFKLTGKIHAKMHRLMLEILADAANVTEVAQTFGLDASGPEARIEVNGFRMAQRFKPDGSSIVQVTMEVTQSRAVPLDPSDAASGSFDFVGGCTLVIDLIEPGLDYAIVKNVNPPGRLARARDYLRNRGTHGLSAYAMQEPFAFLHREKQPYI